MSLNHFAEVSARLLGRPIQAGVAARREWDENTICKAVAAHIAATSENRMTPQGNVRRKSQSLRLQEASVADAFYGLLADAPGHPWGQTRFAVRQRIQEVCEAVKAEHLAKMREAFDMDSVEVQS